MKVTFMVERFFSGGLAPSVPIGVVCRSEEGVVTARYIYHHLLSPGHRELLDKLVIENLAPTREEQFTKSIKVIDYEHGNTVELTPDNPQYWRARKSMSEGGSFQFDPPDVRETDGSLNYCADDLFYQRVLAVYNKQVSELVSG